WTHGKERRRLRQSRTAGCCRLPQQIVASNITSCCTCSKSAAKPRLKVVMTVRPLSSPSPRSLRPPGRPAGRPPGGPRNDNPSLSLREAQQSRGELWGGRVRFRGNLQYEFG